MSTKTQEQIHEELIKEMPYKWRVQSYSKKKALATCVAYIDSRDVQKRLDEVVGFGNWQDDYKEVKGNLYAGIGIKIGEEWTWKWDCGVESSAEKQKGEASDSFKRAAVKWGIGRFLYDLKIKYVTANEKKTTSNYPFPIDSNGKQIWELTDHINGIKSTEKDAHTSPPLFDRSQLESIYKSLLFSDEFTLEEKVKMEFKSSLSDERLASGIIHLSTEKSKRQKLKAA